MFISLGYYTRLLYHILVKDRSKKLPAKQEVSGEGCVIFTEALHSTRQADKGYFQFSKHKVFSLNLVLGNEPQT